ncbi:MAG: prolipoprotein diacylglyceryl transferase [Gammaproteobacteria bacterium]|nr:prolipoprotein diacylglyceryl transferase [Gammaproteobacteria bacterium]
MLVYPGFDPVALELGPLKVRWYGITYLVAFGAAWWLARRRAAAPGSSWKPIDVDDFLFFAMLGVIFGGRIGYVLFYGMGLWRDDWLYPLRIWEGGMSFHGGLIGVLVSLAVFAVRRGRNVADVFDFAAALPGLGICAVRIGNFINGELWGRAGDAPWVLLSSRGNRLSRMRIWEIVRAHAERAGVPSDIGPHTLRHSFATHMVAGGVDLRHVQEMLGHASIATTQRYTHVDAGRLKAIHGQFHPRR